MRTVLAIIRLTLVMLSMAIFLLYHVVASIFRKATVQQGYRLRKNYINVAHIILGIKMYESGVLQKGPGLFVCNHRSLIDPLVILKKLFAFPISKAEVSQYPLIKYGAKVTGIIYVERADANSRNATKDAIRDNINMGKNILIYPEGTVGLAATTMEFKKGSFHVAAENGFPVFPIAADYGDVEKDFWREKTMFRQFIRQFGKLQTTVKIVYGPAIEGTDGTLLMEQSKDWIDGALIQIRSEFNLGQS